MNIQAPSYSGDARFLLLIGATASGKSTFAKSLHKGLSESNPDLRFLILDMTGVSYYRHPEGGRLYKPVIFDADEALDALEEVAEGYEPEEGKLAIHIEECDAVYRDRTRFEKALAKLREKPNVLIIYSTSRVDKSYLEEWLAKYVDVRFVFRTATRENAEFLAGTQAPFYFNQPGQYVLVISNKA